MSGQDQEDPAMALEHKPEPEPEPEPGALRTFGVQPESLDPDLQTALQLALDMYDDTEEAPLEEPLGDSPVDRWQRMRPPSIRKRIRWINALGNILNSLYPKPDHNPALPNAPDSTQDVLRKLEANRRMTQFVDTFGIAKCKINDWQHMWWSISLRLGELAFWTDRYRKANSASAEPGSQLQQPRFGEDGDLGWWLHARNELMGFCEDTEWCMCQIWGKPRRGFKLNADGSREELEWSDDSGQGGPDD